MNQNADLIMNTNQWPILLDHFKNLDSERKKRERRKIASGCFLKKTVLSFKWNNKVWLYGAQIYSNMLLTFCITTISAVSALTDTAFLCEKIGINIKIFFM